MHFPEPPILFLDIDGVMNTTDSALRHRSGHVFTHEAVEALRWIVRETDCEIVISSTRRRDGVVAMGALFSRNGLVAEAGRIIGGTPCFVVHDTDDWREDEIEAWLDEQGDKRKFAILDDKPLSGPMHNYLILTDHDSGLTMALAQRVAAWLRG